MRYLLVVLVLGCGSGPDTPRDPHETASCDDAWSSNGYTDCELGCADSATALTASGPACEATLGSGATFNCVHSFEFDGQVGCCASDKPHVRWGDCP